MGQQSTPKQQHITDPPVRKKKQLIIKIFLKDARKNNYLKSSSKCYLEDTFQFNHFKIQKIRSHLSLPDFPKWKRKNPFINFPGSKNTFSLLNSSPAHKNLTKTFFRLPRGIRPQMSISERTDDDEK